MNYDDWSPEELAELELALEADYKRLSAEFSALATRPVTQFRARGLLVFERKPKRAHDPYRTHDRWGNPLPRKVSRDTSRYERQARLDRFFDALPQAFGIAFILMIIILAIAH